MKEGDDTMFDEAMLSGYLDGELTQAEEQRVRLRLEGDRRARQWLDELRQIREAARTTDLAVPVDEQWDERARSPHSRWLRGSGWLLVVAWLGVVGGLGLWSLWTGTADLWEKLLAATAIGGPVLLFLSVASDRWKTSRTDRYSRVKR